MDVIRKALAIASRDLRWCYRERGIISGSRLVYWSWDSFFAGFGAARLGDTGAVRKNLDLYLSLQRSDGSVPKRIAHPLYWMKFLGLPIREHAHKQRPTFSNSYYTAESIAQNPILVVALHDYVLATGDRAYFEEKKDALERIFAHLERHADQKGLLREGIGGGWAESVLKRGAISFTNMCYARALACMAELSGEPQWEARYRRVRDEINGRLWSDEDGGYYSDWYDSHRHHNFATDGNLLAVWWGIAAPAQAACIQRKISELHLETDIPIKLSYAKYAFWRVFIVSRLAGIKDYHAGFSWTWLGCIDAVAKLRLGKKKEAREVLRRIAEVIVRDGTVHETYDGGRAVRTPFYKSERPWAWGAGLFIYACSEAGYPISRRPTGINGRV